MCDFACERQRCEYTCARAHVCGAWPCVRMVVVVVVVLRVIANPCGVSLSPCPTVTLPSPLPQPPPSNLLSTSQGRALASSSWCTFLSVARQLSTVPSPRDHRHRLRLRRRRRRHYHLHHPPRLRRPPRGHDRCLCHPHRPRPYRATRIGTSSEPLTSWVLGQSRNCSRNKRRAVSSRDRARQNRGGGVPQGACARQGVRVDR